MFQTWARTSSCSPVQCGYFIWGSTMGGIAPLFHGMNVTVKSCVFCPLSVTVQLLTEVYCHYYTAHKDSITFVHLLLLFT